MNWAIDIFSGGCTSDVFFIAVSDVDVFDDMILGHLDTLVRLHAVVAQVLLAIVTKFARDVLLIAALKGEAKPLTIEYIGKLDKLFSWFFKDFWLVLKKLC